MTDNNWPDPARPGVPMNPDRWRGAINDALTNWLSTIKDHETPKDALQRLIRLEVMAALDLKVSQAAADLIAQARRDALEEAARVAEEHEKKAQAKLDELASKFFSENLAVGRASSPSAMVAVSRKIAAAIRALKGAGDDRL